MRIRMCHADLHSRIDQTDDDVERLKLRQQLLEHVRPRCEAAPLLVRVRHPAFVDGWLNTTECVAHRGAQQERRSRPS